MALRDLFSTDAPRRLRNTLFAAGGVLLFLWLAFFDSHSLLRRAQWHHERAELVAENEALRTRIAELQTALEEGISDEVIEQIAREEYGMRKPGETVYRIEDKK